MGLSPELNTFCFFSHLMLRGLCNQSVKTVHQANGWKSVKNATMAGILPLILCTRSCITLEPSTVKTRN